MRGTAAVAGMVTSLVFAAPASALEIRSGSVSDPRDVTPHPQRFEPDIAEVRGQYGALQLRVTLRFHNGPWEGGPDLESHRGPSGGFRVVFGQRVENGRCVTGQSGDAVVEGRFSLGAPPDIGQARLSIIGQGAVDYSRDHSRSGSEDTFTLASHALESRDYQCVGEISTYRDSAIDRVDDLIFDTLTIVDPPPSRPGADGRPGSSGAPARPGAAGILTTATPVARWLTGSARLHRGVVRVRIACPGAGRAQLLVRGWRVLLRRVVRCRTGRIAVRRIGVPRRLRAVRVVVTMGGERVSVTLRR